jgi:ThiF family
MSAGNYQLIVPYAVWRPAVLPLLTGTGPLAVGSLRRDVHHVPVGLVADDLRPAARVSGEEQLPGADWLVVTARPDFGSVEVCRQELRPWRSQLLVVLVIGLEPQRAGWRGWVFEHGALRPLAGLRIIGPGMVDAGGGSPESPSDEEPWSRVRPAVGDRVFDKLRRTAVAVVGVSRLGSQVAWHAAALAVRRLILIDPDAVEGHNVVGMTGVTAVDIGRPKATAVARWLTSFRPDLAVTVFASRFADAQDRLRDVGLLVTTVDQDAPRLQAAVWARRYAVVHLDLGTGVTRQEAGRLLAADVRLLLPGAGCVRCVGGLADLDQAEYELFAPPGSLPRRPAEAWNARGRLGSLPALNAVAAATGMQLWLDLLEGTLRGSTWHRLRWLPGAGWERASSLVGAGPDCPVCRRPGRGAA